MTIRVTILIFSIAFFEHCGSIKCSQKDVSKIGYYKVTSRGINKNIPSDSCLIFGKIIDYKSNKKISYANIQINKMEIGIQSDSNGSYYLYIPSGIHQLTVYNVGNTELTTKEIEFISQNNIEIDFYLGIVTIH